MSVGPVFADVRVQLRHDDLTAPGGPKPVLNETWGMRAYDVPGRVIIDFVSVQECAGASPLKINKFDYGGWAMRGNAQWFDASVKGINAPDPAKSGNSDFLTGEGKHRKDGNHTRPRWVDLSGAVDGRVAGVTVIDHPTNFQYPQPVRLHPNKPYFCFGPEIATEFQIVPGQLYITHYRLDIHDGPPDVDTIERLTNDYANPPRVTEVEEKP
jgi:hypothetical protein